MMNLTLTRSKALLRRGLAQRRLIGPSLAIPCKPKVDTAISHRLGLWRSSSKLRQMKQPWSPTHESFEKLLTWLSSSRVEGAEKYERIRLRLIKYFACNGCGDADEHLADKTIDRVMKKLDRDEIPEPFTGDKALYFLAFAKKIRLEHFNDVRREPPTPVIDPERVQAEDEAICLSECVEILRQEDRWLAIEYYSCDKTTKVAHHSNLANRFDLSLPGLRTRVRRVRERLRPCIKKCLERRAQ